MIRLSRERSLLLVLLLAVITVWWLALGELNEDLIITVLDVGQGDAILIQAPGGRTVLIDAGGRHDQESSAWDVGHDIVVPALLARRVTHLDALIITHPHADHIGGVPAVLTALPVGLLLDPMLGTDSDTYARILDLIEEKKIRHERAVEGQHLNLGRGIDADVLHPPDVRLRGTDDDMNNNSVVLRLAYEGVSVLLTGDLDAEAAESMARSANTIRSTVLKVPHHGARESAVPAFIEAVSPKLAVISVGQNNPWGHPTDEMLRELERVGAKVMRTDRDGAVTITIRPPRWWALGSSARAKNLRVAGDVSMVGVGEGQ